MTFIKGQIPWNKGKGMGLSETPFYRSWINMKSRCQNIKDLEYKNYGGRGITVCKEWLRFQNFYDDMFPSYQSDLTLDRIDTNGNYELENCKWSTRKEQANNRRTNRLIYYMGIEDKLMNWSKFFNLEPYTVHSRLQMGWSIERTFFTPLRVYKKRLN